jgi:hypothetical protein
MTVCSGAEVGTWSSEAGYLQELAITSDDAEPWTEECKLHDISEAKEVLQRSLEQRCCLPWDRPKRFGSTMEHLDFLWRFVPIMNIIPTSWYPHGSTETSQELWIRCDENCTSEDLFRSWCQQFWHSYPLVMTNIAMENSYGGLMSLGNSNLFLWVMNSIR